MKELRRIRVLVADDHFVVRMGLLGVVNSEPDMEVVAEAADGNQAVEMFDKVNPDLVLMDLHMPVKDGIAATSEIRSKHADARILMLSTYDGDTDIHRAVQAGARVMSSRIPPVRNSFPRCAPSPVAQSGYPGKSPRASPPANHSRN